MKLSIITPSYNQGQFIAETFDSILSQNVSNLEYIVMDGGSTDSTVSVVEKYLPKFKQKKIDFTFISKKDKGQSDAINKGWKSTSGDIIAYINSDDYYTKNALREVIKYFKENPKVKWAYGGWNYVDQTGSPFLTRQPKKYSRNDLLHYCNIGQPSCFFRKELLDEFGYLDTNLHLTMDYDLWLKFATKYPAGIINSALSCMRYYKDAKSMKFTQKQLLEGYKTGSKYTRTISWRRFMQLFYLTRGLAANYLKVSKIQKGLR